MSANQMLFNAGIILFCGARTMPVDLNLLLENAFFRGGFPTRAGEGLQATVQGTLQNTYFLFGVLVVN